MSLTEISRSAAATVEASQCATHGSVDRLDRKKSPTAQHQHVPSSAYLNQTARYLRLKSGFDRAAGLFLFVVASPLILLLAAIVRSTSRGHAIYRQTRVGKDGQSFELLKLRSMVRDAEKPGQPVWCSINDLRVTPVGKVLRKLHLDELPQLWNVAKGDMSLVGPRPERPEICENLVDEIENYHHRHSVKPGVTGLSQINLPADQTIEDVRRKQILDLRYIDEANLWLDLRMILATALRMLGIRGETVIKLMSLCRRQYLEEQLASSQSPNQKTPHTLESVQSSESPRFPR